MVVFGLLSLLQIIFLPGYLLLKALRAGTGILATCVLAFALSLLANHVLVAGLVVFHFYRPAVVYAIFALELALLATTERGLLTMPLAEAAAIFRRRARDFLASVHNSDPPLSPLLRRALLAAALMVIGGFALAGIAEIGQIFQQWDAVVSWNRWAVDWAANRLPYATSIYPQLLPTNISLTYVFMQGSEVWIFAKAFQFLFCLALLAAMLDLARVEGQFGYVPGVVITYGLLVAVLRYRMLSSGYADVPLAFFAFTAVYTLLLARRAGPQHGNLLLVGALLATASALTKQTGLLVATAYPLLAWRFILRNAPGGLRRHPPALARLCVIMGLFILPWYLYKWFQFHAGYDDNNTMILAVDLHEGRDLFHRLLHAGDLLLDAITPPGGVLLLIAVAASLRNPLPRWLLGLIIAPLGLIWAAAFSYDLRNLALIVPFVGALAGIGSVTMWGRVRAFGPLTLRERGRAINLLVPRETVRVEVNRNTSKKPGIRSLRLGHVIGSVALLAIAVGLCIPDHAFLGVQRRQQRTVGIAELNRRLYDYAAAHPQTTIASDYLAMPWLPELGHQSVTCTCHDMASFRQTFDRPEVCCVLIRTAGAVPTVRAYLENSAIARRVFEDHGFAFYEKSAVQAASRPSTDRTL